MNTAKDDRLSEFYNKLNADHGKHLQALLLRLPEEHSAVTTISLGSKDRPRSVTRRWWIGALAAAVGLTAAVFLLNPRDAWADIVEALRSKSWIHIVSNNSNGIYEVWQSPTAQIRAWKNPYETGLADQATSLMLTYHPDQKKIVRLELDHQEPTPSVQSFISILLGDAITLKQLNVIERQHRTFEEDGKTWSEVQIDAKWIGGGQVHWTAKVDPKTHLPVTLTEIPEAGAGPKSESRFDYPVEGPTTLAALGVPDDAEVDDRVPKASLANILSDMRLQRDKIGAYHLKQFYGDSFQLSRECWKDGLKWRNDPEVQEICDGREFWMKGTGPWQLAMTIPTGSVQEFCRVNSGWPYLENVAYPFLASTENFTVAVQLDAAGGPQGCVLVERVATPNADFRVHRFTPRREQYWLDPQRGHVLVKRIETDVEASEAECIAKGMSKHVETTFSDFKQSPAGVWYPTQIFTSGVVSIRGMNPPEVEFADQNWRLEAEFVKSFPEELFDVTAAKRRFP